MDGLLRRRGDGLVRLLHVDGEPVVVAVAQPAPSGSCSPPARASDEAARARASPACASRTGVDDDLRTFHERFRDDPVIGRAVRARPGLRVRRNPDPWETLAWAITEQLIDFERAVADPAARWSARSGARCAQTGLRDVADRRGRSPRRRRRCCESFGLAAKRALAIAARARGARCAAGRARPARRPPRSPRPTLARLLAIREIGPWTVEMLALHGLGRLRRRPRGRPRLPQARRAAGHGQPARRRRRGRGARVLRRLRAVGGPRRRSTCSSPRSDARRAPRRAGTRWSAAAPREGGRLSRPFARIQRS